MGSAELLLGSAEPCMGSGEGFHGVGGPSLGSAECVFHTSGCHSNLLSAHVVPQAADPRSAGAPLRAHAMSRAALLSLALPALATAGCPFGGRGAPPAGHPVVGRDRALRFAAAVESVDFDAVAADVRKALTDSKDHAARIRRASLENMKSVLPQHRPRVASGAGLHG